MLSYPRCNVVQPHCATLFALFATMLLAMLAGLPLEERPLPALPFIALSLVLGNTVHLIRVLLGKVHASEEKV